MEEIGLIERIQELTDLELALLLSLVAGEHCIIQTEEEALDPLQEELELVGYTLQSRSRPLELIENIYRLLPMSLVSLMQQYIAVALQLWKS